MAGEIPSQEQMVNNESHLLVLGQSELFREQVGSLGSGEECRCANKESVNKMTIPRLVGFGDSRAVSMF